MPASPAFWQYEHDRTDRHRGADIVTHTHLCADHEIRNPDGGAQDERKQRPVDPMTTRETDHIRTNEEGGDQQQRILQR